MRVDYVAYVTIAASAVSAVASIVAATVLAANKTAMAAYTILFGGFTAFAVGGTLAYMEGPGVTADGTGIPDTVNAYLGRTVTRSGESALSFIKFMTTTLPTAIAAWGHGKLFGA